MIRIFTRGIAQLMILSRRIYKNVHLPDLIIRVTNRFSAFTPHSGLFRSGLFIRRRLFSRRQLFIRRRLSSRRCIFFSPHPVFHTADRASLKKRMPALLKLIRGNLYRLRPGRDHVVLQFHHAGAVNLALYRADFLCRAPELLLHDFPRRRMGHSVRKTVVCSVIQADHAVVVQNRRIKADIFCQRISLPVADDAQILVMSVRLIRHGDADRVAVATLSTVACHTVIQIISAILSADAVRCVHVRHFPCIVQRILFRAVDRPRAGPVPEIIHGSRPPDIVPGTEGGGICPVMGTENIHAVSEYMRLTVRDIFIQW